MKSRTSFTVINPPLTFWLCICILVFFVLLVLINTIATPPPHHALYICITMFVFIPVSLVTLWTKLFRIQVKDTVISVRRALGLVRFTFDVSDIARVEWKRADTGFGRNECITVFTSENKKFHIETLMINAERMMKYITEMVDVSKIRYM